MPPEHNLPTQLTSFIGRERELAEIDRLLSSTRLLTLTGAGGIGKTRLALEVALRVLECFPGGVWLVDLAPLSDAAFVPQTVAAALGLDDQGERPLMERVIGVIGPQIALLLLDNCEHLVGDCAYIAHTLLQNCPHLYVLATSHEPLKVPGEVAWLVPPLSLPDPDRVIRAEEALRFEGVRLFAERARAASPAFVLQDENARTVARICQQLDGIPLVLELASARVGTLSVEQILTRLQDRFRLLATGSRTVAPRHQTLRSLVDWSHDLLAEPEQILFRRLSVFAGGWTLEAAESICSDDRIEQQDVLLLLSQLVDKSLVTARPDRGENRYRLFETLRQYAGEKLQESGETPDLRQRHLTWFRELAERLQPALQGPEQALLLARLETELGNLRTALEWSKSEPDRVDDGLRLSGALMCFWYYRGHAAEGEGWLSALLVLTTEDCDGQESSRSLQTGRAAALMAAGFLAQMQRRPGEARPLAEQALALWRGLGDRRGMAFSLWELGQGARMKGEVERAQACLEESLALARQFGSRPFMSAALRELGAVAHARRDFARAQALFEESLTLGQEEGDLRRVALVLNHLSQLALEQGALAAARARLLESLAVSQQAGVRVGFAPALELLACLAAMEVRPARALRLAGASASVIRALGAMESQYVECHAQAEPQLELARQAVGERAAAAAWAEGEAMSLEQALAYALEDEEPDRAVGLAAQVEASELSARELEVAALIARGLTNREIAAELFISAGTAKRHVENILNKLGLVSRRQVRTWAADQAALAAEAGQRVVPFRQRRATASGDGGPASLPSGGI